MITFYKNLKGFSLEAGGAWWSDGWKSYMPNKMCEVKVILHYIVSSLTLNWSFCLWFQVLLWVLLDQMCLNRLQTWFCWMITLLQLSLGLKKVIMEHVLIGAALNFVARLRLSGYLKSKQLILHFLFNHFLQVRGFPSSKLFKLEPLACDLQFF